jgi:hypothetical protein
METVITKEVFALAITTQFFNPPPIEVGDILCLVIK